MFTMKLFSLAVIVANVMAMSMVSSVDAFSGVVNQQTRTLTRSRQPSQQPSSPLLPPLAYLMREGDDVDAFVGGDSKKTTPSMTTSTIIPTSTSTSTGTATTGTINNDEKMIEDLQNQHLQMMQMMQQQQQQVRQQKQQQRKSLYSVTMPPLHQILLPSGSASPTATVKFTDTTTMNLNMNMNGNAIGIYDKLHDDLNQINIRLLRSKVAFIRRLLPKNKKQYVERFVNFMIKFIL